MSSEIDKKEIVKAVADVVGSGNSIHIGVKKNRTALPPNIMVFQTFAMVAATQLKPATNKVLMLFFANSGYENFVGMDQKSIQEKLGIKSLTTVVNALNELEEHNIIIKTQNTTDRRRSDYFMNPFAAWKGHSETRKKAINMLPENQLSLFGIGAEDHKIREHNEIKNGSASHTMDSEPKQNAIENNRDTSFD